MSGLNGFDPNGPNLQISYTDLQQVKDNMKDGKAEVVVTLLQKTDDQTRPGHKVSHFKISIDNVTSENFIDNVNDKIIRELMGISILYKLGEKNGLKQIDVNLEKSTVVHKQDGNSKESSLKDKLDKKSQYRQLNDLLTVAESEMSGIIERFEKKTLNESDFQYLQQKNPEITKEFIQKHQGKGLQAKIDEWSLRQKKAESVCCDILGCKQKELPVVDTSKKSLKQEETTDHQVIEFRKLIEIANPVVSSSISSPSPKPEEIKEIITKIAALKEEQIEKLTLQELRFAIKIYNESQYHESFDDKEKKQLKAITRLIEERIEMFE